MRARTLIAPAALAALAVGGIGYAQAQRPTADAYVTAAVARGDLTQTFTASGQIDRTGRHVLRFDAPSTVVAVNVKVGDRVTKGQVLASVDPAPLRVQALQAKAQVDAARAQLDTDQRARDAAKDASASPAPSSALPSGVAASGIPTGGMPVLSSDTMGPRAGSGSQGTQTTALAASMKALQDAATREQQDCGPLMSAAQRLGDLPGSAAPPAFPATSSAPAASPTPTPAGLPSSTAPSGPSTRPGTPSALPTTLPTVLPSGAAAQVSEAAQAVNRCRTALQDLAAAEQSAGAAIGAASQQLASASAAERAQLAAAQEQMTKNAQAAAQQAVAQAQASLAAQARSQLGGQITDGTLAGDRARVLQAEQALDQAQRNVDNASLRATEDGTVGALDLVKGASSTGRSVTVVSSGAAEVNIQVPLGVRPYLRTGTKARVGLVGATTRLDGTVDEVSVLPTSDSGTPLYQATVRVDDPQLVLKPGASAAVDIALRSATDAVVVPPSALTMTSDTTASVQVVPDAHATTAQSVDVTTGVIGARGVEIRSGLAPGQLVVIADRRLPVPGGLGQYQQARSSASPAPSPSGR